MRTIFEDDVIKVLETDHDYDFIAIIENKTNKKILILFDEEEMESLNFSIDPNDYVGLLADDNGYLNLEKIKSKKFTVI